MDGAILVVAATDGQMPQTREHLLLANQVCSISSAKGNVTWDIFCVKATFCCGSMLQQFKIDSNCCYIVAQMLLELARVTPLPLTFHVTVQILSNALHKQCVSA